MVRQISAGLNHFVFGFLPYRYRVLGLVCMKQAEMCDRVKIVIEAVIKKNLEHTIHFYNKV